MEQVDELINPLRHTLSKMELALGTINEAIIWTDETGLVQWCNKTFDHLINRRHIEILGSNISQLLPLKNKHKLSWKKLLKTAITDDSTHEIYKYHRNANEFFLEMRTSHLILDNKTTIIIVLKNVTTEQHYLSELLKKEKLLRKQSDLLARDKEYVDNIIRSMSNMLIVVDQNGIITTVNQATSSMLGYKMDELLGKNFSVIFSDKNYQFLNRIISSKSLANLEANCKTKNGHIKPVLLSGSVMFDTDGNLSAIVTIAQDISERKEMEQRLLYLSTHDSLTGLPNRAVFEDALEAAVQRVKRTHQNMALLYIDLDYFKMVNDTFGHRIGDLLLVAVSEFLRNSIRKDDLALRLGGDEFAIILNGLNSTNSVYKIVENIQRNIANKYTLEGNEVSITASIGIAFYRTIDEFPTCDLKKNADLAMYKAKELGRNTYQEYDLI
ncbi:TPA: diguanylate cyclase [Legionella anisa]|uniref:sensor domain-containing protein n=1 Tax=Legionella anisa TaxID=28082 RepID=UPI00198195E1|nr:diguanylate cyclase [Legionella anisa]MBN5936546.1 diguanylate cyclase [Legionella anisa]